MEKSSVSNGEVSVLTWKKLGSLHSVLNEEKAGQMKIKDISQFHQRT